MAENVTKLPIKRETMEPAFAGCVSRGRNRRRNQLN
jgi:hypothetical protein